MKPMGMLFKKHKEYAKVEMKTIHHIYLMVFVFLTVNIDANSQIKIDTFSYSYYNGITQQYQIIDNYKISNNSNEDYYTWVSLLPAINKSNTELIHEFFKKKKGDFSFVEMIYDNLLNDQPINLGYSFIKNIVAGETFSYFIAKTDLDSLVYQDRIVVISKKEVEQYLKMQIDEKYYYQLSNIFLTESSRR